MENPDFLKQKYGLHTAPEVEKAVKRAKRKGEKISQKPAERIQAYLDRLENIINPPKLKGRPDFDRRERNLNMLKTALYRQFVIKPEEIPESYYEHQMEMARELGHGDIEITDELREQTEEVIIADQKSTLDNWVDYLTSQDAMYPDWLKYWAFRNVLSMGDYDKEKKKFTKRTKGTVKPFPDLNREALAYVLDAVEKKYKKEPSLAPSSAKAPEGRKTTEGEEGKEFQKILQGENFSKLYAWAIEKVTPASIEALASTKGEWVKYDQDSDHMPLVQSLQGHGTGWCTAGESTAKAQLKGGDFYVYYSMDEKGKPTIPRAAIRMQGDSIGEVRGIAHEQNLDPYIGDVVKKKLKEFPDGPLYEKKTEDMKKLTEIDKKAKANQELTKDDLIFLYEINEPIEGFGYQRDPRIQEIISQRNPIQDAPIVLECQPEQIATNEKEVNKDTKAYIGPLFPGIFQKNIEHVYTSFPEGRIQKYQIEIGGKDKDQLIKEMKKKNIFITSYANDLLESKDFTTLKKAQSADLVRLTVADLGFPGGATTDEIYQKAEELGLELCPAEVGLNLRLQYTGKDWMYIGMKQITDRDGFPFVFYLCWDGDQLTLRASDARPGRGWNSGYGFVFLSRKLDT